MLGLEQQKQRGVLGLMLVTSHELQGVEICIILMACITSVDKFPAVEMQPFHPLPS